MGRRNDMTATTTMAPTVQLPIPNGNSNIRKAGPDTTLTSQEEEEPLQTNGHSNSPSTNGPNSTPAADTTADLTTRLASGLSILDEDDSQSIISDPDFHEVLKNGMPLKQTQERLNKLERENYDLRCQLTVHQKSAQTALSDTVKEELRDIILDYTSNDLQIRYRRLQKDLKRKEDWLAHDRHNLQLRAQEIETLRRSIERERQRGSERVTQVTQEKERLEAELADYRRFSNEDDSKRDMLHQKHEDEMVKLQQTLREYEDRISNLSSKLTAEQSEKLELEHKLKSQTAQRSPTHQSIASTPVSIRNGFIDTFTTQLPGAARSGRLSGSAHPRTFTSQIPSSPCSSLALDSPGTRPVSGNSYVNNGVDPLSVKEAQLARANNEIDRVLRQSRVYEDDAKAQRDKAEESRLHFEIVYQSLITQNHDVEVELEKQKAEVEQLKVRLQEAERNGGAKIEEYKRNITTLETEIHQLRQMLDRREEENVAISDELESAKTQLDQTELEYQRVVETNAYLQAKNEENRAFSLKFSNQLSQLQQNDRFSFSNDARRSQSDVARKVNGLSQLTIDGDEDGQILQGSEAASGEELLNGPEVILRQRTQQALSLLTEVMKISRDIDNRFQHQQRASTNANGASSEEELATQRDLSWLWERHLEAVEGLHITLRVIQEQSNLILEDRNSGLRWVAERISNMLSLLSEQLEQESEEASRLSQLEERLTDLYQQITKATSTRQDSAVSSSDGESVVVGSDGANGMPQPPSHQIVYLQNRVRVLETELVLTSRRRAHLEHLVKMHEANVEAAISAVGRNVIPNAYSELRRR